MSIKTPSTPATRVERLSATQWLEVVQLAQDGMSVPRIARQFGVSTTSIYRGLKKRGVTMGATPAEAAAEAGRIAREELVKKIRQAKEENYSFTRFLEREIINVITEAKRLGHSPGSVQDDVKTLKEAIQAIRMTTENKWRILGLDKGERDDDRPLPELPIREMTPEEEQTLRDRQALQDADIDGLDDENDVVGEELSDAELDAIVTEADSAETAF